MRCSKRSLLRCIWPPMVLTKLPTRCRLCSLLPRASQGPAGLRTRSCHLPVRRRKQLGSHRVLCYMALEGVSRARGFGSLRAASMARPAFTAIAVPPLNSRIDVGSRPRHSSVAFCQTRANEEHLLVRRQPLVRPDCCVSCTLLLPGVEASARRIEPRCAFNKVSHVSRLSFSFCQKLSHRQSRSLFVCARLWR